MVVRHLSELILAPDGSEKRQVWLRRLGASGELVLGRVLIIHSLKSFTGGRLGSAETSRIQSEMSEYSVTVSGGDAEFIKKRRSSKTVEFRTRPEKGFM